MSKPILVANWKNNPESLSAAKTLVTALGRKRELYKKVSLFIAPPLVYFEPVFEKTKGYARLATQDIFPSLGGPYTGSVTPDILKSFGVRLAIVGHSERRAMGETDELVRKKVKFAMKAGITALVCVGEYKRDEEGNHFEFLRLQLTSALEGLRRKEDVSRLAVAYEPVWAINKSSKGAISPPDLRETTLFIRKTLSDLFGRTQGMDIPVVYGGSVDPVNIRGLLDDTGVDGFLVGRASLDPKKFQAITEALVEKK